MFSVSDVQGRFFVNLPFYFGARAVFGGQERAWLLPVEVGDGRSTR